MSITKCRGFSKQMSQKLSFSFPQKAFRSYQFVNSVIPKQLLEPKLVNSVRASDSLLELRLLGFHKESNSVTPICNFRSDRKRVCSGLSQSVRPISTTRSVRDEFGGDLTLNFQIKTSLRDVFAGQDDLNRGKNHGKAMC